ncbi:MAG: CpsD/CapB family tyrosine-protein kinase, partial [Verrucomicrobia bacterium]|nr:CpsD/CapB family tyrosine-protein kinase [Verrucomicrobiota bacterium]
MVLDTAPINAVSDTLMIAHEAQTICMVMRARKTPG